MRLTLAGLLALLIVAQVGLLWWPPAYLPTNAIFIDNHPAANNTFSTAASFGSAGPMRLATGTYVGDGQDDRGIGGLSFQPDAVFIKCECNRPGVARTSTMTGDAAKVLTSTGNLAPDLVQSLDGAGFTLGTDLNVNQDGATFHWAAFKAGDELELGSYVGDGTDDRSIGGLSFPPDWVVTLGDGNDSVFRPGSLAGDESFRIAGTGSLANRIQALEADGCQLGSTPDVNQSGVTFHYLAWQVSANVTQSTYDGDGGDDRSIGGVGFPPELVWTKEATASQSAWRPASVIGDLTLNFNAVVARVNRLQALEAAGFQVGGNVQVNRNNRTYHYLALRDGGP